MTDPVPQTATELAQTMALLTEQLNEGLEAFETHLSELRLGVSAEIPLDDEHVLGYGKVGRDWRIYVKKNGADDDARQRLNERSRQTRIEVIPYLPVLKVAILKASVQQIEALKQAVGALQDLTGDPNAETYSFLELGWSSV